MAERDEGTRPDPAGRQTVTPDVGDEGGSAGDVEIHSEPGPGTGSEATETWRPYDGRRTLVHRDETGEGRRSP